MLWAGNLLRARRQSAPQPQRSKSYWKMNPVTAARREAPDFLVFVIVAAIRHHRQTVLKTCRTSDDVMALFSTNRKLKFQALVRDVRKLMWTLKAEPLGE